MCLITQPLCCIHAHRNLIILYSVVEGGEEEWRAPLDLCRNAVFDSQTAWPSFNDDLLRMKGSSYPDQMKKKKWWENSFPLSIPSNADRNTHVLIKSTHAEIWEITPPPIANILASKGGRWSPRFFPLLNYGRPFGTCFLSLLKIQSCNI